MFIDIKYIKITAKECLHDKEKITKLNHALRKFRFILFQMVYFIKYILVSLKLSHHINKRLISA